MKTRDRQLKVLEACDKANAQRNPIRVVEKPTFECVIERILRRELPLREEHYTLAKEIAEAVREAL